MFLHALKMHAACKNFDIARRRS